MTETSFPFTDAGGGDDGPYSASFFANVLEDIFSQDNLIEGSVLVGAGNGTDESLDVQQTSPLSKSVEVKEGSAFIQGYYYNNDSDLQLTIADNTDGSGFDRLDTVALEIDFINQVVRLVVVTGTASGSPVAPTLTKTTSIYQVAIADITASNLFTQIVTADIDTTVRTYSYSVEIRHGGTGLQSYTKGDILIATDNKTLTRFTVGADGRTLIPDAAQSTGYKFIDSRPTMIFNSTNGAASSPLRVDSASDPASNLSAAIASNRFKLNAGTYIIQGGISLNNEHATNIGTVKYTLRDNTGAVNIDDESGNVVQFTKVELDTKDAAGIFLSPTVFVADGTEDFEFTQALTGTLASANIDVEVRGIQLSITRIF